MKTIDPIEVHNSNICDLDQEKDQGKDRDNKISQICEFIQAHSPYLIDKIRLGRCPTRQVEY